MTDVIRLFKFSAREEVIAKLVGEDERNYLISNPVVLTPMQNPQEPQKMAIGFMPYFILGDMGETSIRKDSIVTEEPLEVPKGLEDSYLQETTGLAIAKAPTSSIIV